MERKDFPLEIVVGVGLVVVAAAVFLVASLTRMPGHVAPTPTPLPPTQPPTPVSTVTVVPTALPSPAPETATSVPTAAALQIAPDFTLQRADGSTFTLAEQLARGPVVLVFFQMSG